MWAWLERRRHRRELERRVALARVSDKFAGRDVVPAREAMDMIRDAFEGRGPIPPARPVHNAAGPAPATGGFELLVHGECGCGWRCACPEGALWPLCPSCGVQVLPPTVPELRRGYVARIEPELLAAETIRLWRDS